MNTTDLVVDLLSDALNVTVSTEMPSERQDGNRQHVMVAMSGDHSTPYLLKPRYDLICWGTSDRDAHAIALSAVQALQDAAIEHPYFSDCQLETISREEWSRNGQGRYLAVVDLIINTDN